jgi:hypothetical protein
VASAGLILLNLFMIAHIIQWSVMGKTVSPIEPSETMYTLQNGFINAGFSFSRGNPDHFDLRAIHLRLGLSHPPSGFRGWPNKDGLIRNRRLLNTMCRSSKSSKVYSAVVMIFQP